MATDYYNKVKFPSFMGDIHYVGNDYDSYPLLCYNTFNDGSYRLIFSRYPSLGAGPFNIIYAKLDKNGSFSYLPSANNQFNASVATIGNGSASTCVSPSVSPLYYGVKPSQSDGIIIGGVLLAICFFTLIYKMFKRVLF